MPQEISLSTVWRLAQPVSLTLTLAACCLGMASALGCGIALDGAAAMATVLLALLFHAAANVLHAWRAATAGRLFAHSAWLPGASSALIWQGQINLTQARQLAWALLSLVLLAGLWLALKAGGGLLLIGLGGLLLVWSYSAPAWRLDRLALGSLSAALAWWLVVLGADYVQRRHFFLIPAIDAVSFALLAANVALLNQAVLPQFESIATEAEHAIVVSRWTTLGYTVLAFLAHGWLLGGVLLLYHPERAAWAMVTLPFSGLASGLLASGHTTVCRVTWALRLTLFAAFGHALVMGVSLLSLTLI